MLPQQMSMRYITICVTAIHYAVPPVVLVLLTTMAVVASQHTAQLGLCAAYCSVLTCLGERHRGASFWAGGPFFEQLVWFVFFA